MLNLVASGDQNTAEVQIKTLLPKWYLKQLSSFPEHVLFLRATRSHSCSCSIYTSQIISYDAEQTVMATY